MTRPRRERPTIPSLSRIDSRYQREQGINDALLAAVAVLRDGRPHPATVMSYASGCQFSEGYPADRCKCVQACPDAPGENPLLAAILSALLLHARHGLKGAVATCTTDPLRLDRLDGPVKQAGLAVQSEDLGVIFRLEGFA